MAKKLLIMIVVMLMQAAWLPGARAQSGLMTAETSALGELRDAWITLKFQTPDRRQQKNDIVPLEEKARQIAAKYPRDAEPKIWLGIIMATRVEFTKSMSDLKTVQEIRHLLEDAMRIEPRAMEGAAPLMLGVLYYQLPGWPLSFGSNKMAKNYFLQALAIDPAGMDSNFFYGTFLADKGDAAEALPFLERAQAATPKPGYAVAEAARRKDIAKVLDKVTWKLRQAGYNE